MLLDRGYSPTLAATLAGLVGAMQVLGRILMTPLTGRMSLRTLSASVLAVQPVALVVFLLVPGLVGVFALLRCSVRPRVVSRPSVQRSSRTCMVARTTPASRAYSLSLSRLHRQARRSALASHTTRSAATRPSCGPLSLSQPSPVRVSCRRGVSRWSRRLHMVSVTACWLPMPLTTPSSAGSKSTMQPSSTVVAPRPGKWLAVCTFSQTDLRSRDPRRAYQSEYDENGFAAFGMLRSAIQNSN
jgi:hypothetical protein